MNFIEELRWRGLIYDLTSGTDEHLNLEMTTGYVGFDPTSDSLHVGNLVQIILLKLLQLSGNKPIVVIGGATAMIGDPSGKSEERTLLSEEKIRVNEKCIQNQISKFLNFDCGPVSAEICNNHDWLKEMNFLDFIRDYGKLLSIAYMMSKDSVKNRTGIGTNFNEQLDWKIIFKDPESEKKRHGLSFTEFTYQLLQAYDFFWLFKNKGCKLQLGGSDQWGNITTGIELIRKKLGEGAFGITSPLLLKPDGTKFGKTESGNIWLDRTKTSPYRFYQFWLNISDEEALKSIRIFTFKKREEIIQLEEEHKRASEKRILQKEIAKELTTMVHSKEDYERSLSATEALFGDKPIDALKDFSAGEFEEIFEGVPTFHIDRAALQSGVTAVEFLSVSTQILPSKSEARRILKGGGISINKENFTNESRPVTGNDLVNNKYILVQKGKKNYFLVVAE